MPTLQYLNAKARHALIVNEAARAAFLIDYSFKVLEDNPKVIPLAEQKELYAIATAFSCVYEQHKDQDRFYRLLIGNRKLVASERPENHREVRDIVIACKTNRHHVIQLHARSKIQTLLARYDAWYENIIEMYLVVAKHIAARPSMRI